MSQQYVGSHKSINSISREHSKPEHHYLCANLFVLHICTAHINSSNMSNWNSVNTDTVFINVFVRVCVCRSLKRSYSATDWSCRWLTCSSTSSTCAISSVCRTRKTNTHTSTYQTLQNRNKQDTHQWVIKNLHLYRILWMKDTCVNYTVLHLNSHVLKFEILGFCLFCLFFETPSTVIIWKLAFFLI